jgi:ankyrin repeat protein
MKKTLRNIALALGLALSLPAQIPDFTPPTPLFEAMARGDNAEAKRILALGADPNEGRFLGFSPVFFAVQNQDLDLLRAMVAKGADLNAKDRTGSTTLMWAAFNETGDAALVNELLRLGVDPNTANQSGETALTWALRRGYTPAVSALKKAGASDTAMIKASAEKAISLLQKSGPQFVKVSGCSSCHHQSLPQMAVALGRARGVSVDEQIAQQQVKTVIAMFRPMRELMLQGTDKFPNPPISVSYSLLGLAAEGYPADDITAAMAHLISTKQLADGSFHPLPLRPPLESSDFTATALSIRAMKLYGKQPDERIARAGEWLRTARPRTNEERAMQLLGLKWANVSQDEILKAARGLIAEQRPDGGWAQLPALETDAYATGQALVALNWAGALAVSDPVYQRGAAFLLRTQLADGSWLVRTRTFPFQPYKESGFPHGKDQWISAAGTSWAAMALSEALPAPPDVLTLSSAVNPD